MKKLIAIAAGLSLLVGLLTFAGCKAKEVKRSQETAGTSGGEESTFHTTGEGQQTTDTHEEQPHGETKPTSGQTEGSDAQENQENQGEDTTPDETAAHQDNAEEDPQDNTQPGQNGSGSNQGQTKPNQETPKPDQETVEEDPVEVTKPEAPEIEAEDPESTVITEDVDFEIDFDEFFG